MKLNQESETEIEGPDSSFPSTCTVLFYKHEEKLILALIMLCFLKISGSNYAYMLNNIIFDKILKIKRIKKSIFWLFFGEQCKRCSYLM